MSRVQAFLGMALLVLATLWQATASAQDANCNAGQPIKLADQTWESATFTTHVIQSLLEAAYGCKTEIIPGTPAATESALAQNDLQIMGELWSGRSPIIENAIKAGDVRVIGDTLAGGAEQGWYVPDYVVHGDPQRGIAPMAPDLESWQDLPRYKSLFRDPEVPSKGRFLNCPSGWVCEKTNSRLLTVHGLDDDYNNFRAGTGAALDAAISAAYDRGEPILFYYWQPAGLMAKYKFAKIEQDPFNQACWDTIVSGEGKLCSSDFLVARLSVAVSSVFAQRNPELVAFFERLQFEPPLLNQMILEMTESRANGETMAAKFLREHTDIWHAWLPADVAARADRALGLPQTDASEPGDSVSADAQPAPADTHDGQLEAGDSASGKASSRPVATGSDAGTASLAAALTGQGIFPDWSAAAFVNQRLLAMVKSYGSSFRESSEFILTTVLLPIERLMEAVPAWLFLALVALLSWHATRKPVTTVLYVVCLYAIGAVGLWDKLMQTFALVLVSTLFSIIIGIPVGILAASSRTLRRVLTPILDVMQTMPSFVYLIPVLMLFGLGKVPALFATIIYAVPPLIRLTVLGLRHVDRNVMEAAQSFGVTRWQMLVKVTLPLARPSIMAGINQTTMMALAMVVVASMIGARGLGEDVLAGIQTLDVGRGLQAGIAIVILAIVIDRITQAYGRPRRRRQAMLQQENER
ncbi:glycine betaine ABC transporter substrate-binding protein [Allopusillimonas ginsengisoli]|uniref:glycine betaine ABC transporter substrate-binding protein n=1 Tax=Allopusillimonas ginsengisoli TaxID=453575 RepID=UPI00101FFFB3|nr:glycine betaine ABC transporter substrate-binding protein [Allopusillimonas ginsengisoli]TEA69506.1 ABC transporter permease subunit [Allopusillimonas ginsengisoli]